MVMMAGYAGGFTPASDVSTHHIDNGIDVQQTETDRVMNTQEIDSDTKTIQVSASGQAAADPDQAIVQVAVIASADDANVVREQLAQNVTQMREALQEAGIEDDQIRTAAFRIEQDFREENGERRPAGFEGLHTFEITLSNVSQAGPIIDTAVSNGADRVDRVELTLSEERRREVRAEALRDAMENARGDAEVIAESANLTVSGVQRAATGDVRVRSVQPEALEADVAREPTTKIESGPVTVTAQVQVVYNVTDA